MKKLKPGQLCTIKGHVYRCKKALTNYNPIVDCGKACMACRKANNIHRKAGHINCILIRNGFYGPCAAIFNFTNYPVLVK